MSVWYMFHGINVGITLTALTHTQSTYTLGYLNEHDMLTAVQTINSGQMSKRAVQTTFNVPRTILQTHPMLNQHLIQIRGGSPGSLTNKRER